MKTYLALVDGQPPRRVAGLKLQLKGRKEPPTHGSRVW